MNDDRIYVVNEDHLFRGAFGTYREANDRLTALISQHGDIESKILRKEHFRYARDEYTTIYYLNNHVSKRLTLIATHVR